MRCSNLNEYCVVYFTPDITGLVCGLQFWVYIPVALICEFFFSLVQFFRGSCWTDWWSVRELWREGTEGRGACRREHWRGGVAWGKGVKKVYKSDWKLEKFSWNEPTKRKRSRCNINGSFLCLKSWKIAKKRILPQNLAKKWVFKFAPKTLVAGEKKILTSIWSALHPNPGRNIQQPTLESKFWPHTRLSV